MDPQIVYGLAFAYMELGDNRAGERAFYTGAGDKGTGGLVLPERDTFLRGSLHGHHVNMPLAFSRLLASSPRPSCRWLEPARC